MKSLLSFFKKQKVYTDGFNESNWHLDLLRYEVEDEFLNRGFPREEEIITWIDRESSKVDPDYCSLSWHTDEQSRDGKPGLFIAFMPEEKYRIAFSKLGRPPERYCNSIVKLVLDKHDEPKDRKSHPEFGCWLEVKEAEFVRWIQEEERYGKT